MARLIQNILSWITLGLLVYVHGGYTPEMETQIRSETLLSATYDAESRPVAQTLVKIGLNLLAIDELNLKGQKLTMAGWLTVEWEDYRLTWNKTARDDVQYIFAKPADIWKPELLVDNSLDNLQALQNVPIKARMSYTGHVQWEIPILLATHCQVCLRNKHLLSVLMPPLPLWSVSVSGPGHIHAQQEQRDTVACVAAPFASVVDITFYPYDRQMCGVEIVSWGYSLDEVKLEHLLSEVNLEDFVTHGEWVIEYSTLETKNLTEHHADGTVTVFPQLNYWIHLERRTEFYNLNVMMPIILTSLMVGLVFIVPINSGEKVSYVLTVFLALAVLLTIVSDTLPPTSITTSILGLYLGIVLASAGFGVLLTVLILILYHKSGSPRNNPLILTLTRIAARCICWHFPQSPHTVRGKKDKKESNGRVAPVAISSASSSDVNTVEYDVISESPKKDVMDDNNDVTVDITWERVAMIMDRFCFFVFFSVNVMMNVTFVIVLESGDTS